MPVDEIKENLIGDGTEGYRCIIRIDTVRE